MTLKECIQRYSNLIKKICLLTSNGSIKWQYLDSNNTLVKALDLADIDSLGIVQNFRFNIENSFFSFDPPNNMYLVFIQKDISEFSLQVIPNTYRNITCINEKTYPEAIEDLYLLRAEIKHHFPNSEDYIDRLLSL